MPGHKTLPPGLAPDRISIAPSVQRFSSTGLIRRARLRGRGPVLRGARRIRAYSLGGEVELTSERERHITQRHPDLLPEHWEQIKETLAEPDQVRRSVRFGTARLFLRWYTDLRGGKHVVVMIVSEADAAHRHWIITAYMARSLAEGEVEWRRG